MRFYIFSRRKTRKRCAKRLEESPLERDQPNDLTPVGNPNDLGLPFGENPVPHAHALSQAASETREERVARLRQQVRSGTYEIPFPQLVRILADLVLRRR